MMAPSSTRLWIGWRKQVSTSFVVPLIVLDQGLLFPATRIGTSHFSSLFSFSRPVLNRLTILATSLPLSFSDEVATSEALLAPPLKLKKVITLVLTCPKSVSIGLLEPKRYTPGGTMN